ncbi:MAG: zinc ribbon domain-containing protein [Clostridia bacterium]|nr:zinc ribbon domain-containing protein [Clostridia bacterium]
MFCNKCGNPVPDGAELCPICGEPCAAPVISTPEAGSDLNVSADQPIEQAPSYMSVDGPLSAETQLPPEVDADHHLLKEPQVGETSVQPTKKPSKTWIKATVICAVSLLLVAALTFGTAFGFAKVSEQYERDFVQDVYVVCVTDDDKLYLINGKNGSRYLISENFETDVLSETISSGVTPYRMSDDGKRFFYLEYEEENSLKLCYRDLTEKGVSDAVTLKHQVDEFKLDKNGTAYYVSTGVLCINDFKNTERLVNTVHDGEVTEFYVSEDGSLVHYVLSNFDWIDDNVPSDAVKDLYRVTDGGSELIDTNIVAVQSHFRYDGTLYYTKDGAYKCVRPDDTKPVTVAVEGSLVATNEDGSFYYSDRPYIPRGSLDDDICFEAARSEDFKRTKYVKSTVKDGNTTIAGKDNGADSFAEIYLYLYENDQDKLADFICDWFDVEDAYLSSYGNSPGYGYEEGYMSGVMSGYRYGAFGIYGSTEENEYKSALANDLTDGEYDISKYLEDIPSAKEDWTITELIRYYNVNSMKTERSRLMKALFEMTEAYVAYYSGMFLGFAEGYELGYEDFYVFESSALYYCDGNKSTQVMTDYYETLYAEGIGGKLAVRTGGADGECRLVYKDKAIAINPDTEAPVHSVVILPDSDIIYAITKPDAEEEKYDSWRSVTDGSSVGKWLKDYEGFSLFGLGGNGLPLYFDGEVDVAGNIIRSGQTVSHNAFGFLPCPYGNTDGMVTLGDYDPDTDSCKMALYDGHRWYDIDEKVSYFKEHVGYVSQTCVYFVADPDGDSGYYSGDLKCWFEGKIIDVKIKNAYYIDVLTVLEE